MIPKFEDVGDGEGCLLCPSCNEGYLHQIKVINETTEEIHIHFSCEDCPVISILKIFHNNGNTLVEFTDRRQTHSKDRREGKRKK